MGVTMMCVTIGHLNVAIVSLLDWLNLQEMEYHLAKRVRF